MRALTALGLVVMTTSLSLAACGHGGGGVSCPDDPSCPNYMPYVLPDTPTPEATVTYIPDFTPTPDTTDPPADSLRATPRCGSRARVAASSARSASAGTQTSCASPTPAAR